MERQKDPEKWNAIYPSFHNLLFRVLNPIGLWECLMYCGQTNIYRPFWIWTWAVGVLCPSTWPPHSRTSPGKSTWVTLMDVKHNWMDPQKTPFHYCWVFSEGYPGSGPKGSHGEISRCELSRGSHVQTKARPPGRSQRWRVDVDIRMNFD